MYKCTTDGGNTDDNTADTTDDTAAPTDTAEPSPDTEAPEEGGCGSSIAGGGTIALAVAMGSALLIGAKKKRELTNNSSQKERLS